MTLAVPEPRPVLRGCTMANALLCLGYARLGNREAVAYYLRELCRRDEGDADEAADP